MQIVTFPSVLLIQPHCWLNWQLTDRGIGSIKAIASISSDFRYCYHEISGSATVFMTLPFMKQS